MNVLVSFHTVFHSCSQWPNIIHPNQVITNPVSSLDLLPTISHVTTSKHHVSPSWTPFFDLDGRSLLASVKHHHSLSSSIIEKKDRIFYWRFNASCRPIKRALREGSFKWLQIGETKNAVTGEIDFECEIRRTRGRCVCSMCIRTFSQLLLFLV